MISPDVAETLIGCRLMILQSKRLMLNSARRRLERTDMDELRQRVEVLLHLHDRVGNFLEQ